MIICKVLDVSPEWLLSGRDIREGYRSRIDWFVIERDSGVGQVVEQYYQMDAMMRMDAMMMRNRMIGYRTALLKMADQKKRK